jgi:hypothetical protein
MWKIQDGEFALEFKYHAVDMGTERSTNAP